MLEVNNFDAIRISLASPDQIKGWSSGEVTKPETINYRTLKPEKDGLFDERIFGPTKDWECYCGKYKRIRYKGIICDKCGVEVTRSKVRRERMGHIKLASPVSHIWYFKGTPSRLGILLDISPRNLERILYFALYMVTRVDEAQRDKAMQRVDEEAQERIDTAQTAVDEKRAELEAAVTDKRTEVEAAHESEKQRIADGQTSRTEELTTAAQAVEATIKGGGKTLADDVVFAATGEVIGRSGDTSKESLAKLREVVKGEVGAVTKDAKEALAGAEEKYQASLADLTSGIEEATATEREHVARETDDARLWARTERARLADIQPLKILTEAEYRNLTEMHGRMFDAGMGAEAVKRLIEQIDLDELSQTLHVEMRQTSGQRRKKAIKRLRLIEAFRKSGARPEWMILSTLPVIPPDLRPMVQLDGGRFATSDLNDLYRRVINRNNRLSRLLDLEAPEIIIRNEKRMLQEACDALIDNGRRGRAIAGTGNHRLKSLSDMLKGKQGRFRQNLLGKRVDYSGRSVIVVGPELKLHQCGLPKKMALELFKPFVMRQLVEKGFAHNIKSAKRIVERVRPEVWDVLEDVIKDHPVLLNRAPTLHRLGIQAFMPVLVEGSAIQIHPLVCFAFNADFDGDQMAVHVPLSTAAQQEAKDLMLSTRNLLSAADGSPVVSPTHDMVLGCFYLTMGEEKDRTVGTAARDFKPWQVYSDDAEVILAVASESIHLQDVVRVETETWDGDVATGKPVRSIVTTTAGRVIFNSILPPQMRFVDRVMDRKGLKEIIARCYRDLGPEATATLVDGIKAIGFHYATEAGITIGIEDLAVPKQKAALLKKAEGQVDGIDREFRRGFITEDERYTQTVEVWRETTDKVTEIDAVRARRAWIDHAHHELGRARLGDPGPPAGRHARSHGRPLGSDHRPADPLQPARGDERPRVLHLEPRRQKGPGRHRPAHRRLRVPDPAPGGRRAGRHHARGRLRAATSARGSRARSQTSSPSRSSSASSGAWRRWKSWTRRPRRRSSSATPRSTRPRSSGSRPPASTASAFGRPSPASRATACAACATAATWPPATWSSSGRRSASSRPSRSASRARSSRCGPSTPAASPARTSPRACRASRSSSRRASPRARPR